MVRFAWRIKGLAAAGRRKRFTAHDNQVNQHERRGLTRAHFRTRSTVFPSAGQAEVRQHIVDNVALASDCPGGVRMSEREYAGR